MPRTIIGSVIFLAILSFLFQYSSAQHFVKMSDQQRIELALDMIRKGVQEEDTTKVFMAFAPQVVVKGKNIEGKGDLTERLQVVFDNSSQRKLSLEKPSFPREDNPLRLSNFWDFDILDPGITIKGDSAFVDCELVLWGVPSGGKSPDESRKVKERFVFISPPRVQLATVPEGSHKWPTPPSQSSFTSSRRSWKLMGYENFVEFLENQVKTNTEPEEKTQGEEK